MDTFALDLLICIRFVGFMFKVAKLFSPDNFNLNDKVFLNIYFWG